MSFSPSGVTASWQDDYWLRHAEKTQQLIQGVPGSVFAYYQDTWNISIARRFAGITKFKTTAGLALTAWADFPTLNTSPTTTISYSNFSGFTIPAYIQENAPGQINPFTGGGDETMMLCHQVAPDPITFSPNPDFILSAWPEGLTADVIEPYFFMDSPSRVEFFPNWFGDMYKSVKITARISRKFVRVTAWSPVSNQWVSPSTGLPALKSEKLGDADFRAVTLDLSDIPLGSAPYINSDSIDITNSMTGEGEQTLELTFLGALVHV